MLPTLKQHPEGGRTGKNNIFPMLPKIYFSAITFHNLRVYKTGI